MRKIDESSLIKLLPILLHIKLCQLKLFIAGLFLYFKNIFKKFNFFILNYIYIYILYLYINIKNKF
jgi:hypothetical protein